MCDLPGPGCSARRRRLQRLAAGGPFPGSHINSCEHKEFQAAEIPLSKDADGNPVNKSLEGEYYYYDIGTREGLDRKSVV